MLDPYEYDDDGLPGLVDPDAALECEANFGDGGCGADTHDKCDGCGIPICGLHIHRTHVASCLLKCPACYEQPVFLAACIWNFQVPSGALVTVLTTPMGYAIATSTLPSDEWSAARNRAA
jgi:hypothetical protein